MVLLLALGIGTGAWAVRTLNDAQRAELTTYLDELLRILQGVPSDRQTDLLRASLSQNLRSLIAMWVGGAIVIGVPLVLVLIFVRGFVVGFTVGFLAAQGGWKGVVLSLGAVLPHHLLAVPAFCGAAVAAVSMAGKVLAARRQRWRGGLGADLAGYFLLGVALAALLGLASLVEAYVTPACLRLLSGWFRAA